MNLGEVLYKDYLPLNANIFIRYNKGDRVRFEYPNKMGYWKAVFTRAYPTVMIGWLFLHLIPFFYILDFFPSSFILICVLLGIVFIFLNDVFTPQTVQTVVITQGGGANWMLWVFLGYFVILPLAVTVFLALKKEWLSSFVPRMGAILSYCGLFLKYKEFTKDDSEFIVPMYNNVYLKYKTEGDFDKYFEGIDVVNIPYSYLIKKGVWSQKKVRNEYYFSAVFHFSQQPQNGKMEVEYI